MTPQLLGEYLDVLRNRNVLSAGLEIPMWTAEGHCSTAKLSVQFGPSEPPELPPLDAGPGGWKQPFEPTSELDLPLGDGDA